MKLGSNAFTAGMAVTLIVFTVGFDILRPQAREAFGFELTANGADMSRHGVTKLTLAKRDGRDLVVVQRCNGGCDDLSLKLKVSGDDGALVEATDAAGQQVASSGAYLTHGSADRLALVGTDKLEFRYDTLGSGY